MSWRRLEETEIIGNRIRMVIDRVMKDGNVHLLEVQMIELIATNPNKINHQYSDLRALPLKSKLFFIAKVMARKAFREGSSILESSVRSWLSVFKYVYPELIFLEVSDTLILTWS